jgi:hypothetical protein
MTGKRMGGEVEIVRGLQPGDRVVVAGTFLVDSESRLKNVAPVPLPAPSHVTASAPAVMPAPAVESAPANGRETTPEHASDKPTEMHDHHMDHMASTKPGHNSM